MIRIYSECGSELVFPDDVRNLEALGCSFEAFDATSVQTEEDLVRVLCNFDVIVTNDQHQWTQTVLRQATKTKLLIRLGKGVDNVDIAAAKECGILVANTGSANASSVAEHTMALMLAAVHNLPECDKNLREGNWSCIRQMHEIKGLTIGLAGFGAIAQSVAKMLSGFSPKEIIAYDPFPNQEAADKLHVKLVSFDELLARSQILSVHVPLMDSTYHMFNKDAFSRMDNCSIFVSTSRGHVVDEDALYDTLLIGKLHWAAMDVFEQEPLDKDNRLLKLKNVFGTPHTAAHSYDAMIETHRICLEELADYVQEKRPQFALW